MVIIRHKIKFFNGNLNSGFFLLLDLLLYQVEKTVSAQLFNYISMWRDRFMPFTRAIMPSKTQAAPSRI